MRVARWPFDSSFCCFSYSIVVAVIAVVADVVVNGVVVGDLAISPMCPGPRRHRIVHVNAHGEVELVMWNLHPNHA